MRAFEIFIPLTLGMQVFWVVMLSGRVVDFRGLCGNVTHTSSGVVLPWNPTLKMKAVGFIFKTSAIFNPAFQRNNPQDANLQPTKLHDLKSQKTVILPLINLGINCIL
jgi:hypothetical protein